MELLLCTNGSADSKIALRLGVSYANALHLPVVVLGVIEMARQRREVQDDVARTVDSLQKSGIDVRTHVITGDARHGIPAEANRGDYLTVVGSLAPPRWRQILRGPTLRHVLEHLKGPVLCAFHAREPETVAKVLICSGGLHHADAAIQLGSQVAAAFGAEVTLLHVAMPHANMPVHLQDPPTAPDTYLERDTLYAQNLQRAMATFEAMELAATFELGTGDPLREILHAVRDSNCDLVVVGSHATVTGPARLVGDITHRIVERAGCPVLVVRQAHA